MKNHPLRAGHRPFRAQPWRSHMAGCALALLAAQASHAAQPGPDTDAAQAQAVQWRQQALAYEHAEGVPRDPARATTLYCHAARLGDAEAQYHLGWMYAHGRGVERDDAAAAYFFASSTLPAARLASARFEFSSCVLPPSFTACVNAANALSASPIWR